MLNDTQRAIAWCATATLPQLTERYRELYGEPTRSRNVDWLRRWCAWRIQANATGELHTDAIDWIERLGAIAPERWVRRSALRAQGPAPRDPRLPPPGTKLRREFGGTVHEVTVTKTGFEFRGKSYPTLSAVANAITGRHWNGFRFFGIKQ